MSRASQASRANRVTKSESAELSRGPETPMRHGMLKDINRTAMSLAIALQLGACNPTAKGNLLDGCYFLGGEPILEIQGLQGTLLVPGDITQFRLVPQGSSDHIWMTTQPSFVIGGSGQKYAKHVGSSPSPSPVIIIEIEGPTSSRVLVHDNGHVARLVRQDSCPTGSNVRIQ